MALPTVFWTAQGGPVNPTRPVAISEHSFFQRMLQEAVPSTRCNLLLILVAGNVVTRHAMLERCNARFRVPNFTKDIGPYSKLLTVHYKAVLLELARKHECGRKAVRKAFPELKPAGKASGDELEEARALVKKLTNQVFVANRAAPFTDRAKVNQRTELEGYMLKSGLFHIWLTVCSCSLTRLSLMLKSGLFQILLLLLLLLTHMSHASVPVAHLTCL
jgi:hypothetical protein